MLVDALRDAAAGFLPKLDGRLRFRRLTARFRALPSVYIIGGARCGTTALWEHLEKHPAVLMGRKKELFFWGNPDDEDKYFSRGLDPYRMWFPTQLELDAAGHKAGCKGVTVDATPYYLYSQAAPRRLRERVSRAKVIALLRNPVDRAISDHNLNSAHFDTDKGTLEDAIRTDAERVKTNFRHAYIAQGIYEPHIRRWMAAFPETQMLVLKAEDLFRGEKALLDKVVRFLDLSDVDLGEFKRAHGFRLANKPNDELRAKLTELYRPHNERLYEFLGQDFGWEK
jgi:hypothetical protein